MAGNKLGIFVRVPAAGAVKTRLLPALSPEGASELYTAFLGDLFERLHPVKAALTVFYGGGSPAGLEPLLPRPWPLVPQPEGSLGERMNAAFDHLLSGPGVRAVLIGSDSPDLPLIHIRHAFQRLKHRDVVLGPALDGGFYLIGLRARAPGLLEGIAWGDRTVFAQTIEAVARQALTLSVLPPWYDVDDPQSLDLLRALCAGRRLAGGVRLPRTERILF